MFSLSLADWKTTVVLRGTSVDQTEDSDCNNRHCDDGHLTRLT